MVTEEIRGGPRFADVDDLQMRHALPSPKRGLRLPRGLGNVTSIYGATVSGNKEKPSVVVKTESEGWKGLAWWMSIKLPSTDHLLLEIGSSRGDDEVPQGWSRMNEVQACFVSTRRLGEI